MKHNILLIITTLLLILFMTVHLADDIIRGIEKGGPSNLVAVPILAVWELYCSPNGGWDMSSSSSGRSLGCQCPSSTW